MSGKKEKTRRRKGTNLQQRRERRYSNIRATYFKVKFRFLDLVIK
jgi:hypothetical protein